MCSLTIRPLAEDDRDAWQGLWDGYRRFYGRPDQDEAAFARDFGRLLSGDPHDFACLVAEGDDRLLGLTHYLFTRPDARGRGVGRALIEAVAAEARRRGAGELYWLTAEDNYAGRMLYDGVARRTRFIKYARNP